jgi:DNA-directed RNA polymerase specialized sigma24 family protein
VVGYLKEQHPLAQQILAAFNAAEKNVMLAPLPPPTPRLSPLTQVVELKFFGGMTTEEIGQVLAISPATVEREWRYARAWLYAEIEGGPRP